MRWPLFPRRRAPVVTVIIPTYNWATVLPFSIGSVLAQTYADFELLVIGDGCTDESEAVVASFRDRRVRWINLPTNTGRQVGPNNEGLRQARGRFIAYLGHDDLWLPRHLERLVGALERSGSKLAVGQCLMVNAAGRKVTPMPGWVYDSDCWLPPTSVVHTCDAACEVGGWRLPEPGTTRDPETDLWARITAQFGPPVSLDELTCIKFPAAHRPQVYEQRPCHEQQEWLRIIRETNDPESHIRRLAELPVESNDTDQAIVASWPSALRGFPYTAEERYQACRVYKGLPPLGQKSNP